MFSLRRNVEVLPAGFNDSKLFDQNTFYQAFLTDLSRCRRQVIIESPFVTSGRTKMLLPILDKLRQKGVQVVVNTRDPQEHEYPHNLNAEKAVHKLQQAGVKVLYTGGHHRKLAILDGKVLWEGSLNILSHADSCEVMRRIHSETMAQQMLEFIKIYKFLG